LWIKDREIEQLRAELAALQLQSSKGVQWYKGVKAALREQEPVGWTTEDFDTDKSATTYDRAVAERWAAKGWPVEPLYRYQRAIPEGWQPIETAPRDGTEILAYWWYDYRGDGVLTEGQAVVSWDEPHGWEDRQLGETCKAYTHWKPLPTPPMLEGQQENDK
jgi:hypothetical protein